jgi:Cullin family
MLNDISLSKEYQEKFAQKKPKNPIVPLVLTSAHWPVSEPDNLKLPEYLTRYTSEFDQFYKALDSAFSLRIIKWIMSEGKAEVFLNLNGKVQLDVKTQQLPILFLFEKQETQTFKQIQELSLIGDTAVLEEYLRFMCGHQANIFSRSKKEKVHHLIQIKMKGCTV